VIEFQNEIGRDFGLEGKGMDIEALKSELVAEEGEVLHAYQDHLGYWTIGVGRLIDERRGGGITHEESMYLLGNDIARVVAELAEKIGGWNELDDVRKRALCSMAFQMGVDGLLGFRNTLAYIRAGDYERAADNAMQSLWARQTPSRAKRVTDMIRTGVTA